MISFDEAIAVIRAAAQPLGAGTVQFERAAGRVLAAPVIAAIDSPRTDVSAMDGYAVRDADLHQFPVSLRVCGESFPGYGWQDTVEPHSCVRIFTGAPLPAGADRVVIQELVRRDGDHATIDEPPGSARWVRAQGSDFRTGDELLSSGRLLDAAALIAAAGGDAAELKVYTRPLLAVLSTGDELVAPGEARNSPQAIADSVSLGVATLAQQWGAQLVQRTRVPDQLPLLEAAAGEAASLADVIVVTGGASVGERDLAKAMFAPLGMDLLFSKVAIRPGKPAWLGRLGAKLVIGLPGNPTSALVTARLLLVPLLARMTGRTIEEALCWQPARLTAPLRASDARETFHRAQLAGGEAVPLIFQDSHAQKALADADVLVRQAANTPAMRPGEQVQVLRL